MCVFPERQPCHYISMVRETLREGRQQAGMLRCIVVLGMHCASLQQAWDGSNICPASRAHQQARLYVLPAAGVEDMYFPVAAADCQVMAIRADGGCQECACDATCIPSCKTYSEALCGRLMHMSEGKTAGTGLPLDRGHNLQSSSVNWHTYAAPTLR
jgi:hypothetical protein